MNESDFQRRVIDTARRNGWLVYHPLPAMNRRGRYTTPMVGDPGFPDLVIARPGRVMFRELKVDGRYPAPAQRIWLRALPDARVWRPRDFETDVLADLAWRPERGA